MVKALGLIAARLLCVWRDNTTKAASPCEADGGLNG
jgi:hypothetical protein